MKNQQCSIVTVLLFFVASLSFAQGITRIPFLEIGIKPIWESQSITDESGRGSSIYNTKSIYNDKRVKEIIKTQKELGFKKYEKAEFLLADVNMLQASYPIETGYTYRIFSVSELPQGFSILRAKNESGIELVPEIRNEEIGSISSSKIFEMQLQDIVCKENQTIYIENGMMSQRTIYYATTYLIFKKKS